MKCISLSLNMDSLSVVFMFGLLDLNSVTCPLNEWPKKMKGVFVIGLANERIFIISRCLCTPNTEYRTCVLGIFRSLLSFEDWSRWRKNCAFLLFLLWVRPIPWCYCLRVYCVLEHFCSWANIEWKNKNKKGRRKKKRTVKKTNRVIISIEMWRWWCR